MKYLPVLFLSLLIVWGCSDKKGEQPAEKKIGFNFDSSDVKISPVSNPNEAVLLRYKLVKDKKYTFRWTNIITDKQEIKADSNFSSNASRTVYYIFTVVPKEIDVDSVIEIECALLSAKLIQTGPQSVTYETGKAKDSTERSNFADFESLLKNTFRARISKEGEIVDVYKVDRIVDKYIELKGYADSVTAQEKAQVKTDIIESALKPVLSQIFRRLPDQPVAKDSMWTVPQPPSKILAFDTKAANTYLVAGLGTSGDKKIAEINAGFNIEITGNNKANQRGINYNFNKPLISASGKIFFDVKEGVPVKVKTKMIRDISFNMDADTPKGHKKAYQRGISEIINIIELL